MKRLWEGYGANTMEGDPLDLIIQPDIKRANSLMFYQGASGQIPTHWNNSPFLTGGRMTSAFGANPRLSSKNKVLSYQEFIDATRRHQNK
jgi:hypothetical protein